LCWRGTDTCSYCCLFSPKDGFLVNIKRQTCPHGKHAKTSTTFNLAGSQAALQTLVSCTMCLPVSAVGDIIFNTVGSRKVTSQPHNFHRSAQCRHSRAVVTASADMPSIERLIRGLLSDQCRHCVLSLVMFRPN
jgi:hypothetical protein